MKDPDLDGQAFDFSLRFPGQRYDAESGLHQNVQRDYDAQIGRFVTSDPLGLAGGISTYSYVKGNPLSLIDPDGLQMVLPPPAPVVAGSSSAVVAYDSDGMGASGQQWDFGPKINAEGLKNALKAKEMMGFGPNGLLGPNGILNPNSPTSKIAVALIRAACADGDDDGLEDDCQEHIQACKATCTRAGGDFNQPGVWGGNFVRCLTGCVPFRCQDLIKESDVNGY
jgi:RHS repeat-associated protein